MKPSYPGPRLRLLLTGETVFVLELFWLLEQEQADLAAPTAPKQVGAAV